MIGVAETESLEALVAVVSVLSRIEGTGTDRVRVDQLGLLERVKSAAAAAQVRITAAFVESQSEVAEQWHERARECSVAGDFEGWRAARDHVTAASLPVTQSGEVGESPTGRRRRVRHSSTGTGVSAQVALARHESPVRGAQHVGLALALTREMPHTLAALEAGELSEARALIIVRETAGLGTDQRSAVDAEVVDGSDGGERVGDLGDKELARRVRAVAYRIDAEAVMARSARAEADRRVTIRPAPDTMAYVTALLPVAQAVAVHASLTAAADSARAAGDERGKGQVMADALVTRVTGQERADAVPVEVQLVMTDRSLLVGDGAPAQLLGYGSVPAEWARRLLRGTVDTVPEAAAWLRRLYTHPQTGALVAMDSTRRTFEGGLRRYLLTRDAATCRTPWCDAPVRHVDHIRDHADGGPTTAENGQGLCVRCNLTKQLPGFRARPLSSQRPGAPHTVETVTPTGHHYRSTAPPLLPGHRPDRARSHLEAWFEQALAS